MELPSTTGRVPLRTDEAWNRRIHRDMEMRVWFYAQNQDRIEERLQELDHEWDIERVLEAKVASGSLIGTVLGVTVSKRFFFLPLLMTGFLLQHALQGWCPPVPILRRLGVRTQAEIESERYALKALRGDFQSVEGGEAHQRINQTLRTVTETRH